MKRVLVVALLMIGIGSAAWLANTIAQEATPAATVPRVGDDEAGRLPPGYSIVVTKSQRAKIYTIQDSYQKQLDDLKKQIATIESKRDQEIAGVLDDEQKKIIEYVYKLRERERKAEPVAESASN
jgi:peptidoglycan hydrolase CwlO-like protein